MSTFEPSAHPRSTSGTFTTAARSEPNVELSLATAPRVDRDGWVVRGDLRPNVHTTALELADPATVSPGELMAALARFDAMSGVTWDTELVHDVYFEYALRLVADGTHGAFRRKPVGHAEHGEWEPVGEVPRGARAEFCSGSPDDECLAGSCSYCWGRPEAQDLEWVAGRGYEDAVDAFREANPSFI